MNAGDHLRTAAAALPAACGVYLFHGEPRAGQGDDDALPLYIGKSVNLRARVQSHLRNPDEERMLRQTRRITYLRTAGEIGALLLEAQLVKQRQPLYNKQLRRTRQLCSLRLSTGTDGVGGAPEIVYTGDVNFAREPHLHGLFSTRRAAQEKLTELADEHRLCLGLLGLERLSTGRGCFRVMVRRCAGACRGDEPREAHDRRLAEALAAMRLHCWPYPGAVGLVEEDHELHQVHVVRDWCYLGSVERPEDAATLARAAAGFDADGYRILCGSLLGGQARVVVF